MTDRPCLVDGVQVHQMEDGFFILNKAQDRVHYLNPTAALVMMLCDGNNTSEEISSLLQREYGLATPPTQDVGDLLAQLRDEGLLTQHRELAPGDATL